MNFGKFYIPFIMQWVNGVPKFVTNVLSILLDNVEEVANYVPFIFYNIQ